MPSQLIFKCPVCRIRCKVSSDPGVIMCVCGYVQFGGVKPGLGDWVSAILHRCGITKARYIRIKAWFGFKPTCKCPHRQVAMNAFGARLKRLLMPWRWLQ